MQQAHTRRLNTLSLKSKLVLSYLLVILGTVLVLSFAVSVAVQNYFRSAQIEVLSQITRSYKVELVTSYRLAGGDWDSVQIPARAALDPNMLVVADARGGEVKCFLPEPFPDSNCSQSTVETALKEALKTDNYVSGDIHLMGGQKDYSSVYVGMPLKMNGQVVGAIFLTQPRLSPESDFLSQINQAIILAGLIVAAVAVLCSYLFVRRFVRPMTTLTLAAEQMKQGEYTQRVTLPHARDELGLLAQTFNEMADTIEADMSELRRQDKVRRDLIANIAHDLATPLTAIQGLSEALADDVILDPEARHETAQRIGKEVQRLRRLVADVRQMTLLEAGQIHMDLAPLDVHSLVDETIVVIAPECEHAGIKVYNDIAANTPHVIADSDRVTQVLLNLLDNARRHTATGGSIRVSASQVQDMLQVAVTDSGIGIDPADLPHIFERFYRADRSRTTSTGGSGLGLAIVKAIISAHRGTIWAESTPGVGTTIRFTLPLAPPPVSTAPATPIGSGITRRATVPLQGTGQTR